MKCFVFDLSAYHNFLHNVHDLNDQSYFIVLLSVSNPSSMVRLRQDFYQVILMLQDSKFYLFWKCSTYVGWKYFYMNLFIWVYCFTQVFHNFAQLSVSENVLTYLFSSLVSPVIAFNNFKLYALWYIGSWSLCFMDKLFILSGWCVFFSIKTSLKAKWLLSPFMFAVIFHPFLFTLSLSFSSEWIPCRSHGQGCFSFFNLESLFWLVNLFVFLVTTIVPGT